jgi:hypothetical protein
MSVGVSMSVGSEENGGWSRFRWDWMTVED